MNRKFDAIICLSQIDWDFLWQRTQEVMTQFSKMGYPVLFVENTGVRLPKPTDAGRIWKRLKKQFKNRETRAGNHNVQIYSPMAIPSPYSSWAVEWNKDLICKNILQFSREKQIPLNRILLWSYMTTPLALEIANAFLWAGVVVDLVSDPCKVMGAEKLVRCHGKMLERASTILCASMPTVDTAKQYIAEKNYSKICLFEDGFSINLPESVSKEMSLPNLPSDFITGTTAAYIGGVNDKIWWEAVSIMTSEFPEMQFVFAGPKDYDSLPCSQINNNVKWLPTFDEYVQLGIFLGRCAVGLIPYKRTPFVSEMRPAKINEYLVMGLPIVATRLPELERFSLECGGGVMYLADTPVDFVDKLRQALEEDCEELRTKRRDITLSRSWEKVCWEIVSFLQGVI